MDAKKVWKVIWNKSAKRQLRKLDRQIKRRIEDAVDKAAESGNPRGSGGPLTGPRAGQWRYVIGNYRAIVTFDDGKMIVNVVKAGHRSNVYKIAEPAGEYQSAILPDPSQRGQMMETEAIEIKITADAVRALQRLADEEGCSREKYIFQTLVDTLAIDEHCTLRVEAHREAKRRLRKKKASGEMKIVTRRDLDAEFNRLIKERGLEWKQEGDE